MTLRGMPLSDDTISALIASGEAELREFKREWYDLTRAEGKATFAKDVLALANTARPDAPAFLLFGVEDERRGSVIVGVTNPPEPESVSNLLAEYILPPADVRCRHHRMHDDRVVSVVAVHWSPARPHHALRDFQGILSSKAIYVRRDRTIGVATLPEVETMIREKGTRLGPLVSAEPLQCGFVQKSDSTGRGVVVGRITNVTTEPVSGVDVTFDVRNARNPELFERSRRLTNAVLEPGESREAELRLRDCSFYVTNFSTISGERLWRHVQPGDHVGDKWLDVTMHVFYRDREGFIRHIEHIWLSMGRPVSVEP